MCLFYYCLVWASSCDLEKWILFVPPPKAGAAHRVHVGISAAQCHEIVKAEVPPRWEKEVAADRLLFIVRGQLDP